MMTKHYEHELDEEVEDDCVDDDLPRLGMKYLRQSGIPRGMASIFNGLIMMIVTTLVMAIVTWPLVWLLGQLSQAIQTYWPSLIIFIIYGVVVGGGWLIGFIMTVVGKVFCLDVPERLGPQWSIIISVVLEICGLAVTLLAMLPALRGLLPFMTPLSMIGYVVFAEFLRKIASFAGKTWLKHFAIVVMTAYGLCLVCAVSGSAIIVAMRGSAVGMVLITMSILGMLVSLVLYTVLVSKWKYYLGA